MSSSTSTSRSDQPVRNRLVLMLLPGLLMVVVLAAWCVWLAVSVQRLRPGVEGHTSLLRALDATETLLYGLHGGLTDDSRAAVEPQWLAVKTASLKAQQLDIAAAARAEQIDEPASLAEARASLEALVATADGAAVEDAAARSAVLERSRDASTHVNALTAALADERAAMLETLWQKWQSLFVVLALLILLSTGLTTAILIGSARARRRQRDDMDALQESERRFRLLAENLPGVVYLCKNDERYTALVVNDAVETLTGYPARDFLDDRVSFQSVFHPDDAAWIPAKVNEALSQRKPFELKYRMVRKDGTIRWVEEVGVGVFSGDRLEYLEGFIYDVTSRHETEMALTRQRAYLRQVLDLNPSFIFAKDREGRFTLANQALAKAYGTSVDELIGKTDADFNPNPEEVAHYRADDLRVLKTRQSLDIPEETVFDASGRQRWFQTCKKPISDEHGEASEVLGVAIDITRLKEAQLSEARRNRVLEGIATGLPLTQILGLLLNGCREFDGTLSGLVARRVPGTEAMEVMATAGIELPLRRQILRLAEEGAMNGCQEAMQSGLRVVAPNLEQIEPRSASVAMLLEAGIHSCWIEPIRSGQGDVLGTLVMLGRSPGEPDEPHVEMLETSARIAGIIMQREQAEEELRDSQERLRSADRLASIGTLTAGLGHDMNNVLFPLRCRLDTIDASGQSKDVRELLELVRVSVDFLQQLSNGLRMMAVDPARNEAADDTTQLEQWWPQVLPMIHRALPEGIRLQHDLESGLPALRIQPHQLTQAVLNLAINAAEASKPDSTVAIRATADTQRQWVRLSVQDWGSGMTNETKSRVLEPFFTTKHRGLSTGLGMSLVHGVMKSCGGTIDIDSSPGRGTTVTLTIPSAAVVDQPGKPTGTAVVTLADARIAGWISSLLASSGYAVRRTVKPAEPVALWVTDATEDQLDAARALRQVSPTAQFIVFGNPTEDWFELGAQVIEPGSQLTRIQSIVKRSLHPGTTNHEHSTH